MARQEPELLWPVPCKVCNALAWVPIAAGLPAYKANNALPMWWRHAHRYIILVVISLHVHLTCYEFNPLYTSILLKNVRHMHTNTVKLQYHN